MSSTPVEEIKGRLDIVDLINEYVPLKAAGTNWRACCPFHNEKTPSFMVSREKGMWHCFGCGRGGDAFSFVQEMEGLDFPEVLRLLAKRTGVEIRDYDPKLSSQRTRITDVLRWSSRYFQEVYRKSGEAAAAREYLQQRQLTDETIDDWGIGYAPAAGDVTYQALRKKGFSDDDIFQSGLTIKRDRGTGYYDRFRGRIIFPIADVHGAVVGFSGRILEAVLDPGKPVPAKYINSPQTVVYNKSLILFGLDKAKQAIKKGESAVIVEGQMDCIMSHQAGVANVVASSGTALTIDQVLLLKRFTANIILALDQDAAGAQATLRGVDQAFQAQVMVRILRLGFGKDPDELIRKDPAAWRNAIAAAQPIMDYYFEEATLDRDLGNVVDKKAIAKMLLPLIAKLVDPVEQAHYLQRLGDLVHVDENALWRSLPQEKRRPAGMSAGPAAAERSAVPVPPPDRYRALSERWLALLVQQPDHLAQAITQVEPESLSGDDLQRLYKTLIVWYSQDHLRTPEDLARFSASADAEQQNLLNLLALLGDKEFAGTPAPAMEQDVFTMVAALKQLALSAELRRLESDIRRLESRHPAGPTERAELDQLLERFRTVTEKLRALSQPA